MTSAQCIEARRLLALTQMDLAKAARLSKAVIITFEASGHLPRAIDGPNRMSILTAFFEKAGVEFTNGDQPGVKLRKTEP